MNMTLRIFLVLTGGYALLAAPAAFFDAYLDSLPGLLVAIPVLSVYLFHAAGIPGLLVNNGACGWGWCPPTAWGWIFLAVFWLGLTWLIAMGLARLLSGFSRPS